MSPTSYQGQMQKDEDQKRTYSQTESTALGATQPGITVASILAQKGNEVFSITPETTVLEAISQLNSRKIGVLLIVHAGDSKPVGILSERDIVRSVETKGLSLFGSPVKDVMTPDPFTCTPDDTVDSVMHKMTASRFRHMPVLKNDKLCGLISIGDVVQHRLNELEYENLKIKQAMVG